MSGNNNNGTVNGAVLNPNNGFDGEEFYSFPQANQNIELANQLDLTQFTIAMWVNITSFQNSWALPIGRAHEF